MTADPRFTAPATPEPPKHEKPVEGWKAIANELDVSVETVQRMARRNRDPLPVWKFIRTIVAWKSAIQDWKARNLLPLTTTDQLEALEGRVATAIPPADDR